VDLFKKDFGKNIIAKIHIVKNSMCDVLKKLNSDIFEYF
jgi:hypothetical protein